MKELSYRKMLVLAVAAEATSPNPGAAGVWAWSSTLARPVCWNGTKWVDSLATGISSITYDGSDRVTGYTREGQSHTVTYPDSVTIVDTGGGRVVTTTIDGTGRVTGVVVT